MRGLGVSCLALVVMAVVLLPQQSEAQGWQAVVPVLVNKIKGLWRDGEFELMGHICNYSVTPKIKRWQLYYKGRMWCPGWTTIRGEAETRSQSGVVGKTVGDFVEKAHNAGFITEHQARQWLAGQ